MNINRLECRERTIRASHDGTEIIRTFYVDPYEAHTVVLSALLGAVEPDPNDATKYIRRKPAEDSWFTDFYCTDAWVEQVDQQAMAASPSLGMYPPGDYAAETLRRFIGNLVSAPDTVRKENPGGITIHTNQGRTDPYPTSDAGCFIRASFKPLIHELPGWSSEDSGTMVAPNGFDFVDPLLIPLTKTVASGVGMKYLMGNAKIYANVGSEGFVTQPMWQFTIRRLMVGKPPLLTINRLKGKINSLTFTIGNYVFPYGTLRFDDCEVVKRAVPYSDGTTDRLTVWYDLLYVFTWNTIWDEYFSNTNSIFQGPGYVGWNRILGCPKMPITGVPIPNPDPVPGSGLAGKFAPISYYEVGWKSRIFDSSSYRKMYLTDLNDPNKAAGTYQGGTENGFYDLFNPASE